MKSLAKQSQVLSPLARNAQKKLHGTLEIHPQDLSSGEKSSTRLDPTNRPASISEHMAERLIRLTSMPPTTNKLFYNSPGKGRRKTAQYRAWLATAGWELRLQKIRPLSGRVALDICLPDKPGRAPDADNALKACIDLLVRYRVIEGDDKKVVRSVAVRWDEATNGVCITICRAGEQPVRSQPRPLLTMEASDE